LSSLIAQYDNNTSSKLAKESLRDSKAMKTLSILTILFLPGAFVATVFSTDMFDFRDKNQEIWIYFVIVVPLTAIIMTGWYLWLKNTPDNGDEEAGGARPKENSKGDTKEGKSD
jgi:Mg2+ and Co2+ transporter CorA